MNLTDVRNLFDYTEWANGLALNAAAGLTEENLRRDFNISHSSILGTLVHMAGAEWIWLERWHGNSPPKKEAWSLWTNEACPDLKTLNQRWRDVVDRRVRFISEINEARLMSELPFKLLSGDPSSLPLVDQMHHVANHATMHRGQVVGMIRQMGLAPPSTDLLFYLRSDIPA
ncbi:MAG: hypothetical protein QOG23_1257 [Blastocatellia bacterium]|jgi:uncharacterized damage-inducible protein DinB|nr:hypothetical protein [Blastocatellia bacterium]